MRQYTVTIDLRTDDSLFDKHDANVLDRECVVENYLDEILRDRAHIIAGRIDVQEQD